LENRARAGRGIEPGMRAAALDLDRELACTLAGRLQLAGEAQGRFEYVAAVGTACQPADLQRGLLAAGFLVRIEECDRSDRQLDPQEPERPEGENQLHQPPLHIVRPWTLERLVLEFNGHAGEGPQRPDCVGMTEQELKRRRSTALAGRGEQQAAALAMPLDDSHAEPVIPQ